MLEIMHFFWILIPYKVKIIVVNLARTFYHRHKTLLDILKNDDRPKLAGSSILCAIRIQKLAGSSTSFATQTNSFVSIIIPTFNNPHILKNCLEAIKENTRYKNYEVILVNNNSFDKKSLEIINKSGHKVIKCSYKFNFSKINNFAVKYAKGEYLLFLNNDTIPQKDWLVPMLNECQKEDVGVVGSKLLYSNNTIQHAGMAFDAKALRFFHSYRYQPANIKEASYIREVHVVTGSCLMVKKRLFEQVGGFDEDYWVECQDSDLCLKIRKFNFKVVYTPYSVVYHREGATRGLVREDVALYDLRRLRKKWFYNYLILNSENTSKNNSHKILLIKLLSMGDVIMATSIIEAMRKKYPNSEIVFATSYQYKDIIEGNPYLDKVYVCRDYDGNEFDGELNYYKVVTLELLYKENWDLVYQIQILDLPCGYWGTDYHLRDLYADLANVRIKDEKACVPIMDFQRSKINSLYATYVENNQKIILLHTTSGWKLKDWDYKKYPLLIRKIRDKYNTTIFQIGGNNDISIEDNNVIHLEGKLTLKEVAALMEQSDLLICPDSGMMHMASAIGLSIIALFGPTSPPTGGPINGCNYICIQSNTCCDVPCHMKKCFLGKDCAKDISVEAVLDAVDKMLNKEKNITQSWWRDNIYEGLAREAFNNRSGTGGFSI